MLLAIDIGNTNTVFAVCKGAEILNSWRCRTVTARTADEYAAFLHEVFRIADLGFGEITDVICSSVVPESNFHLTEFTHKFLGLEPVFVTKDLVDIAIDLERPEDVGADRLVNAVAVCEVYRTPAVVIDFGTATTFDVIDSKGQYAGGVIAPGINLSVEALNRAAAKLPKVSIQKPERVIGKSTVKAIQSGIFWGYVGLIEGIIKGLTDELGEKLTVIATGGLAPLFSESIDIIEHVDHDLTLKGLLKIYQDQK